MPALNLEESYDLRIMRQLLVFAVLVAPIASGVTDADRLQAYHEFRAAFDAKRYLEALPLAQKVVSLTEEQYGTTERALLSPLANLGTTEYRLKDFKSAEDTYLRAVKLFEDSGGGMDRIQERVLHGLGATYFATGQLEDASVVLKRAVDLSRNLDGLFNADQTSILDRLTDTLVALDRHEEAERAYEYSIRVAETSYGKADLRVMKPLQRSAHWQERMGRYATARVLYARALQIAEQASDSARSAEPLEGIARTYRLEFVNADPADNAASEADPLSPAAAAESSTTNSQRLNPDGEHAILLAVRAINKVQPLDHLRRGTALVELGDWYLSDGMLSQGMDAYRAAWRDFEAGGSTATLSAPRQLAYRPPMASVVRTKADRDNLEEHYVEAVFTVTKEGRTDDIRTADSDASESQQKAVLSALRRARYAPRFEHGEPVDTAGVKFRERMLAKKPRAG